MAGPEALLCAGAVPKLAGMPATKPTLLLIPTIDFREACAFLETLREGATHRLEMFLMAHNGDTLPNSGYVRCYPSWQMGASVHADLHTLFREMNMTADVPADGFFLFSF